MFLLFCVPGSHSSMLDAEDNVYCTLSNPKSGVESTSYIGSIAETFRQVNSAPTQMP